MFLSLVIDYSVLVTVSVIHLPGPCWLTRCLLLSVVLVVVVGAAAAAVAAVVVVVKLNCA